MNLHCVERLLLTFVLALSVVALSSVHAAAGVPKIQLKGELSSDASKAVSVEELEKLPLTTFSTYNPFVKTVNSYTGVLLSELAKTYGTDAVDNIVFIAVDDYQANFKKDEWDRYNIMLATQVDGEHMEIKDSGPAKIIIDYEKIEDEQIRAYNRKWIWLVKAIVFKADGE